MHYSTSKLLGENSPFFIKFSDYNYTCTLLFRNFDLILTMKFFKSCSKCLTVPALSHILL